MKVYDIVKRCLENDKLCRDSDKRLIWFVWHRQGTLQKMEGRWVVDFCHMNKATSPETIRRCRQKIQELEKERIENGRVTVEESLLGSKQITKFRELKEQTKGTFIYHEV